MSFSSDAFTNTDGTSLPSHDAKWSKHTAASGSSSATMEINSNAVRKVTAEGVAVYRDSTTPPSADYSVTADVTHNGDATTGYVGLVGRLDATAYTCYMARIEFGGSGDAIIRLYSVVSGVVTEIGSYTYISFPASTAVTFKLEMIGTAIKVYTNGTQRISKTSSSISAAGYAGIWIGGGTTSPNPGKWKIDNYDAVDLGSGGNTGTGAPSITAVTAAGEGEVSQSGTGTPSIAAVTAAGEGTVTEAGSGNTGSGTPSITAITSAGSGSVEYFDTGSVDDILVPAITISGEGIIGFAATGSPSIGAITASGSGTISIQQDTAAPSIAAITVAGEGTISVEGGEMNVTGTGALTLPAVEVYHYLTGGVLAVRRRRR